MSAISFGMLGAFLGHPMMGMDLTMLSAFGLVALTAVVVNDRLVLVEFINREQRVGTPLLVAIREAGVRRKSRCRVGAWHPELSVGRPRIGAQKTGAKKRVPGISKMANGGRCSLKRRISKTGAPKTHPVGCVRKGRGKK